MNEICPNCLYVVQDSGLCAFCGKAPSDYVPAGHHLPVGTVLESRYLIGRALWEDDYGIAYLSLDQRQGRRVVVKEYFPKGLVRREAARDLAVSWDTEEGRRRFTVGRDGFLKEARALVNLDRGVLDFFVENVTAYLVAAQSENQDRADAEREPPPQPGDTPDPAPGWQVSSALVVLILLAAILLVALLSIPSP